MVNTSGFGRPRTSNRGNFQVGTVQHYVRFQGIQRTNSLHILAAFPFLSNSISFHLLILIKFWSRSVAWLVDFFFPGGLTFSNQRAEVGCDAFQSRRTTRKTVRSMLHSFQEFQERVSFKANFKGKVFRMTQGAHIVSIPTPPLRYGTGLLEKNKSKSLSMRGSRCLGVNLPKDGMRLMA